MTLSLSLSQVRKKHLPSGSTKSTVPRIAMHGRRESNRRKGIEQGRRARGVSKGGGQGRGSREGREPKEMDSGHDIKINLRLTILLQVNIL